jgi:hypothetical protein
VTWLVTTRIAFMRRTALPLAAEDLASRWRSVDHHVAAKVMQARGLDPGDVVWIP